WASEIPIDALEMKVEGVYPRFTRLTGTDGHILNVRTREPLGLLTRTTHRIEASSSGKNALREEWTVLRENRSDIEAVAVGVNGVPIELRLEEPRAGVVLVDRAGHARIHGEMMAPLNARLTINGKEISRLADKPGYEFDTEIVIPEGGKEVVVRGDDGAG